MEQAIVFSGQYGSGSGNILNSVLDFLVDMDEFNTNNNLNQPTAASTSQSFLSHNLAVRRVLDALGHVNCAVAEESRCFGQIVQLGYDRKGKLGTFELLGVGFEWPQPPGAAKILRDRRFKIFDQISTSPQLHPHVKDPGATLDDANNKVQHLFFETIEMFWASRV